MNKLIAIAASWLLTAGCAVGPTYHAPVVPQVVARNIDSAQFSHESPAAAWWQQFGDPVLTGLERRALADDLDLKIAIARVRSARAVFTGAELEFAPHLPLAASATRGKQQQPGFTAQRVDVESYSVGFDASWELDLFGRVRHATAAARAELGAAQANFDDTQVIIAAEVARNYFELRGAQRQLAVARTNMDNEREALRLSQVRYDAGRVTELDVDSAQARLSGTEATVPLLEAQERGFGYRLAVLLGLQPGALDAELAAAPSAPWTAALPIGDVSGLLRRRPDVRAAERELAAATARVGVATADLFPRVSLTGFVGFLTGDSSQIVATASRAWSVTPTVSWTALDFGSTHARLRAARADADVALASYQKAVLVALEDFENACLSYGKQGARLASVTKQAEASRRAAQIATIQYREGGINFIVLLDAQRTLLQAEDAVAQAETAVNTGAVAVYKALGGALAPETIAQRVVERPIG